jgi:heptosyltransferase II
MMPAPHRAAGRELVVRAPNHLGDLVMALPALERSGGDILVVRGLVPLLELVPGLGGLLPLDRGRRGVLPAAALLRRNGYRRGVLLTPSFSSALTLVLGGVRERRGGAGDGRRLLLTDVVEPVGPHRASEYLHLVTGRPEPVPPQPRVVVPPAELERFSRLLGTAARPLVGIFPGSNAPSRRWDPERFRAVAEKLTAAGITVVVFGGPAERHLTAEVAGAQAVDLGGRTDLRLLAAGLASCDIVLTNDSGPMHLAAAVGRPTVSLLGAADPIETAPLGERQVMIRHPELPCVPCVKNVCPRRGPGYVLPEAQRECLRLIGVDDVESAVLAGVAAAGFIV